MKGTIVALSDILRNVPGLANVETYELTGLTEIAALPGDETVNYDLARELMDTLERDGWDVTETWRPTIKTTTRVRDAFTDLVAIDRGSHLIVRIKIFANDCGASIRLIRA